jgi:ribonuclease P protein component
MDLEPRFRPRHRLRHALEFRAVYDAKLKKPRGPLIVWGLANTLEEHRLGLAIGKRVGSAVERNALKRRLREAFRLGRADFPLSLRGGGYDLVVGAQAHARLKTEDYRLLLTEAVHAMHRETCRRERRARPQPDDA